MALLLILSRIKYLIKNLRSFYAHPYEIMHGGIHAHFDKKIVLFPEKFTTLDARKRYWIENPPKGLWKLVPEGLRLPPRPYDDYAAVLLGERFLENPR